MNRYIEHLWCQIVQHIPRVEARAAALPSLPSEHMDGYGYGYAYHTKRMMFWMATVSLEARCFGDDPHALAQTKECMLETASNSAVCFRHYRV